METSLPPAGPSRGHVFLIDDHHELRFNLTELLRLSGYSVEAFDSADAFLQHHANPGPAVVLADMHMPGTSGLELQDELIRLGRRLPMVFISGGVSPEDIRHALQQGAAGFLLKPFTRKELCEVLDRALMSPQP